MRYRIVRANQIMLHPGTWSGIFVGGGNHNVNNWFPGQNPGCNPLINMYNLDYMNRVDSKVDRCACCYYCVLPSICQAARTFLLFGRQEYRPVQGSPTTTRRLYPHFHTIIRLLPPRLGGLFATPGRRYGVSEVAQSPANESPNEQKLTEDFRAGP
jgi:hypothetical protein